MGMKYKPDDFEYPLNEDIQAIYDAKEDYDKDPDNRWKYYLLQKSIYMAGLTMKALCSCRSMTEETREELLDYFWGLA